MNLAKIIGVEDFYVNKGEVFLAVNNRHEGGSLALYVSSGKSETFSEDELRGIVFPVSECAIVDVCRNRKWSNWNEESIYVPEIKVYASIRDRRIKEIVKNSDIPKGFMGFGGWVSWQRSRDGYFIETPPRIRNPLELYSGHINDMSEVFGGVVMKRLDRFIHYGRVRRDTQEKSMIEV